MRYGVHFFMISKTCMFTESFTASGTSEFSIKLNTFSRFQGSGQLNFRRAGRRELVTSTHSRYGTDPHHPGWSKSTKGQSQGMPKKHKDSFSSIRCNCQWPPAMSQMRTIVVPPLGLSVAVTSARPKIFITVQKTLDGLYNHTDPHMPSLPRKS